MKLSSSIFTRRRSWCGLNKYKDEQNQSSNALNYKNMNGNTASPKLYYKNEFGSGGKHPKEHHSKHVKDTNAEAVAAGAVPRSLNSNYNGFQVDNAAEPVEHHDSGQYRGHNNNAAAMVEPVAEGHQPGAYHHGNHNHHHNHGSGSSAGHRSSNGSRGNPDGVSRKHQQHQHRRHLPGAPGLEPASAPTSSKQQRRHHHRHHHHHDQQQPRRHRGHHHSGGSGGRGGGGGGNGHRHT